MLNTSQEKMMEMFEVEYGKRFHRSLRQTIINQYQAEEYNRIKLTSLKEMSLLDMLSIVNGYIPLKIAQISPSIITTHRKEELVFLRTVFIYIAFSAGHTNKQIREFMQIDRVTILVQIKKLNHMKKHNNVYEKNIELYTAILAQIVSENERPLPCNLRLQPDTQPDLSFVLDPRQDCTFAY